MKQSSPTVALSRFERVLPISLLQLRYYFVSKQIFGRKQREYRTSERPIIAV